MSHEIYLNIHCAAPDEIPSAFPNHDSLTAFTEKHPSRLCVGSDGSDVYEKLEHAVAELGLAPLSLLNWDAATEKIEDGEVDEIFIKRIDGNAIVELGKATDAMIAAAIAKPHSLIVTSTQFDEDEAGDIARAASEPPLDMENDDLSYYDLGESWDHFFYFLYLFREICREGRTSGKGMILAWTFS